MKIFVVFVLLGSFLYKDVDSRKATRNYHQSNYNKIVGGYNATIEQFPYQVYLLVSKDGGFYECGGSIINNKNILTAAHCLAGVSSAHVKVGATSSSDEGEGELITSSKLTQHPKYSKKTYDYDIGIVTLERPIKIDGVKTKIVRLADKESQFKPGQNVTVTGWGVTSENGDSSDTLLAVDVPIISNEECRKVYRSLTPRMFCAGFPQGGKDACQGDSGGPAVIMSDGLQVGVVSHGVGCARKGFPGVYISVATVRDWIKQVSGRFSANWVDNFNHSRLHRGLCLTRSCPSPSPNFDGLDRWLESCVNASIVSTHNLTARLYHLDYCTTGGEPSKPLNTSEMAFVAFVVLLLVLTVVSTTLDVIVSDDMKKDCGWALSWSLISSWRSLTAPAQASRSSNLLFFDGLRVFCMLSVIVEHVCWLGTQAYVSDTRYVELTRRSSDAMLLANSTVMVQIFFLMASFLLAHKLLQEQQGTSSFLTFLKMMFNRIIRISPSYFIVLWFASSFWERVGDGPQWSLVVTEAAVCRRKWWEQLLYVSNLVNTDDKCLIQTWYLAADMQLYALALALTLWLRRARRPLATLGVIAIVLVVGNLVLAYILKLVPTFVVHNPELIRAAYKGEPSFDWMYTSPHSNAAGALAGVLLAHLHHAGLAIKFNLLEKRWFRLLSVWAVPATVLVVAIWPHLLGTGVPPRLSAAASAALERPVFVTLVTIALFGAMSGVDSPWVRWMSCGTVAARLSFGALLLHMLLIKSFLATRLAPVHLDRLSVYIEWFGFSILSYLAAAPLALLVEFPAQRLHKEITMLLQNKYHQISETKIDDKSKLN